MRNKSSPPTDLPYRVVHSSVPTDRCRRSFQPQKVEAMPFMNDSDPLLDLNAEADSQLTLLQKDLNLCEQRKAEAELAVIYLAGLNAAHAASVSAQNTSGDQFTSLQDQLQKAEHKIQLLKTKLDNAMDVIFMLSKGTGQVHPHTEDAALDRHGNTGTAKTCKGDELIDLLGSCLPPSRSDSSEDQKTLLDCSSDDDTSTPTWTAHTLTSAAQSFSTDIITPHKRRFQSPKTAVKPQELDLTAVPVSAPPALRPTVPGGVVHAGGVLKPSKPSATPKPYGSWSSAAIRYGICYVPEPKDSGVYRTIHISGLPADTTLSDILGQIQCGAVFSIKLVDTVSLTGSYTAIIIFMTEDVAGTFYRICKENPISFNGNPATVTHLSTPTWPMTKDLRLAIAKHGHTRCLEIHNYPADLSMDKFRMQLQDRDIIKTDRIVHSALQEDRTLDLQFSSVIEARDVFDFVKKSRQFARCTVQFAADPCALLVEGVNAPHT